MVNPESKATTPINQPANVGTIKSVTQKTPATALGGINKIWLTYRRRVGKIVDSYRNKEETWKYSEIALTLFVVSLFLIFAIRPAVVTISSLVGEIKSKETLSSKMRKKINSVILAQENYAIIQQKADIIDSFLPTSQDIGNGLAQLIGVAGDSNVSLQGLSVSETTLIEEKIKAKIKSKEKDEFSNLAQVRFNLSVQGDYFDLKKVISDSIETKRWIELNDYQISKNKDETQKMLNLSVNGELFYWNKNEN